jgi:hypothetical protein
MQAGARAQTDYLDQAQRRQDHTDIMRGLHGIRQEIRTQGSGGYGSRYGGARY